MRGSRWAWLPWVRRRARRAARAQAIAWTNQRAEYERAVARVLNRPSWDGPTLLNEHPLMTLAAEYRSRQSGRWQR